MIGIAQLVESVTIFTSVHFGVGSIPLCDEYFLLKWELIFWLYGLDPQPQMTYDAVMALFMVLG